MKKKILGVTLIVTIAVVAALNINLNKSKNSNGDLAFANQMALAQDGEQDCSIKAATKTEMMYDEKESVHGYEGNEMSDSKITYAVHSINCPGSGNICCTPLYDRKEKSKEEVPCPCVGASHPPIPCD